MNDPDQDRLLREIVAGEEIEDFRRGSLAAGLASIRAARRRRRAYRACALGLAVAAVAGIALERSMFSGREAQRIAAATPAPAVQAAPDGVKIIDEKQLFALFPNRSIALIGKPGQERFYFLDTVAANGRNQSQ
jgi:hypothetical protein